MPKAQEGEEHERGYSLSCKGGSVGLLREIFLNFECFYVRF